MKSPAHHALETLHAAHPNLATSAARELLTIDVDWALRPPPALDTPVWQPEQPYLVVDGSLTTQANVLVRTGRHDNGALIVLGDLRCRNLIVSWGFDLVVTGSLLVEEVVITAPSDSQFMVGGDLRARLLASGTSTWVTLAHPRHQQAQHTSGYVMAPPNKPSRPPTQAPLTTLLLAEVLDREEWDAMDEAEQANEDINDILRVDTKAAHQYLAAGRSLLR
ncbi:hypothetical protein F0U59_05315 [Archangium gephyra]|nr:hypothetical protein F0U59_05315 [Archangium gephyra]